MKCPHCNKNVKLVKNEKPEIIKDELIYDTSKINYRKIEDIKQIVIHHSASDTNKQIQDIHNWHREKKPIAWAGCGYHYVIHYDGSIHKGREHNQIGAHCRGHNDDSIGICLIGNFELTKPSEAQTKSLSELIVYLQDKVPTINQVRVHSDLQATKCPGKLFKL